MQKPLVFFRSIFARLAYIIWDVGKNLILYTITSCSAKLYWSVQRVELLKRLWYISLTRILPSWLCQESQHQVMGQCKDMTNFLAVSADSTPSDGTMQYHDHNDCRNTFMNMRNYWLCQQTQYQEMGQCNMIDSVQWFKCCNTFIKYLPIFMSEFQ